MPGNNQYSMRPEEKKPEVLTPSLIAPKPSGQTQGHASNYGELLDYWERYKKENPLETPEQAKKRRRREKWEGVISGIGDAASAVSNLIFTTQGAPSMYNPAASMSKAAQARFDRAKAARDQNLANYMSYAMNIGKIKDADRNWRRQLEQDKIAAAQLRHDNEIADAKAEREKAMFELNQKLANQKLTAAEYEAQIKRAEAKYAERIEQARLNKEQSYSSANRARADYYNNGGNKKQGEFPWYDKDGQLHYAHSYDAAKYNSMSNGTWVEGEETSTSTTNDGFFPKTTTSKKPGNGRSEKPSMDMPGVRRDDKTMPGVK